MNDILLTTDGINLPEVKEQKEHSKDRLFHKQHMQVETQGVTFQKVSKLQWDLSKKVMENIVKEEDGIQETGSPEDTHL